jgi:hypothetical protein
MTESYTKYLVDLKLNDTSSNTSITAVEESLKVHLPSDYLSFIKQHNGVVGPIGENSFLNLWSLDILVKYNEGYGVNEFAPGLILFGSDGGDTAYAFDTRDNRMPIVEVPFIGMDLDEVKRCGNSFVEFLKYLYNQ